MHLRIAPLSIAILVSGCVTVTPAPTLPQAVIAAEKPPVPPAWLALGNIIEAQFQQFAAELASDHKTLLSVIDRREPSLKEKPPAVPVHPLAIGYRILPSIIGDPLPSKAPARAISSTFSWSWTHQLLSDADKRRADLRARLARAETLKEPALREELNTLVSIYRGLESSLRFIDSQVKYNRFWQADIAGNRPRYDVQTAQYELVVQREALRDVLARKEDPLVRRKEQELAAAIHDAAYGPLRPPPFVTGTEPRPGLRVLHILVRTDIEDMEYLRKLREAVETKWHVVDGDEEDRLEIDLEPLAPGAVESSVPAHGAVIDENAHIARFPKDAAVMTTGGRTTYALPGRALVLGPGEITPTTLAHEFGHLFGFIDGYFRGYRDKGGDGFWVLEIVPDPTDIICAPGIGHVQKSHYDALFRALKQPQS